MVGKGLWGSVYARHRLDLGVRDVAFGILSCGRRWRRESLEAEILDLCSARETGLVCSCVRGGWDLWLEAQDLRAGDEVIVSAITHPDMVRTLRAHGLRAVPVDLDPGTLAPRPRLLEAALTPRTRMVLVAHLFGGLIDLDPVVGFVRENGLLLAEDCAQAFQGPERVGRSSADVSMYSFGTLKTSSALGGAVLRVGDRKTLHRMRGLQKSYPVQRRGAYLRKLLPALVLVLATRPRPYAVLVSACAWLGHDLDALLGGAVRAFPPGEPDARFFGRLRHRPCTPLLAMLLRRLKNFDRGRLARRASVGERFACSLRDDVVHPGRRALRRTHWLFPVVAEDPETLIPSLRSLGLDASRAASSIAVVESPEGCRPPPEASLVMSGVVFLPVNPDVPPHVLATMADLVNGLTPVGAAEPVAS